MWNTVQSKNGCVQLSCKQSLAIKRLSQVHMLTRYSNPVRSGGIRRPWKLSMTVTKVMLHHANLTCTGIRVHIKPELRCPAKMWNYNPCVQVGNWHLPEYHLCSGNQITLKKHANKSLLGKLHYDQYLFVCLLYFQCLQGHTWSAVGEVKFSGDPQHTKLHAIHWSSYIPQYKLISVILPKIRKDAYWHYKCTPVLALLPFLYSRAMRSQS